MKKAVSLALAIILIAGTLAIPASARWTYVAAVENTLTFSGSTANCNYDIQCYNTYTIKVHSELQKKSGILFWTSWDAVTSVDRSYTGYSVYDYYQKAGLSGGTYKLVTTFKIYSGSTLLEEITRESERTL